MKGSRLGWSRRRLLQLVAAAGLAPMAAGLAAALGACRGAEPGSVSESGADLEPVIAEIRAGLGGGAVEAESLEDFARDYLRFQDEGLLTELIEVDLPRRFLLSSDLFDADRLPGAPAVYVVFYDPYLTPCSNRLARLPEPAS